MSGENAKKIEKNIAKKVPGKYGIKETIKKCLQSPWLPFVFLWLVLGICHLLFKLGTGDDKHYALILQSESLPAYLYRTYFTWSSRTLVEAGMVIMNSLPGLCWRLLNPVMGVLCAFGLSRIVGAEKDAKTNWFICAGLLLYPWQELNSAGWITTTLAFLWPAAMWLLATAAVAKQLRGARPQDRLHPAVCVLSLFALFYAVFHQQVAVIAAISLAGLVVWRLLTRQRLPWLLPAQLGVAVFGLGWHMLCPATAARFEVEQVQQFPNFGMKSLVSKLELGLSVALDEILFSRNMLFFFFSVLLCWLVWQRQKHWFYRTLGVFPLAVCAVLGMFQKYTLAAVPRLAFFTDALNSEGMIVLGNCNTLTAYIPLLLLYFTAIVCLVDVYLAFGHTAETLGIVFALACGLASRAMMGFSPSLWVSGPRCALFFSLTILGVSAWMLRAAVQKRGWGNAVFWALFAAYVLLQIYSMQEMRIATGYF